VLVLVLSQDAIEQIQRHQVLISYLHVSDFSVFLLLLLRLEFVVAIVLFTKFNFQLLHYLLLHFALDVRHLDLIKHFQYELVVLS